MWSRDDPQLERLASPEHNITRLWRYCCADPVCCSLAVCANAFGCDACTSVFEEQVANECNCCSSPALVSPPPPPPPPPPPSSNTCYEQSELVPLGFAPPRSHSHRWRLTERGGGGGGGPAFSPPPPPPPPCWARAIIHSVCVCDVSNDRPNLQRPASLRACQWLRQLPSLSGCRSSANSGLWNLLSPAGLAGRARIHFVVVVLGQAAPGSLVANFRIRTQILSRLCWPAGKAGHRLDLSPSLLP